MVTVAVEGETDREIVRALLSLAGLDNVEILVANGHIGPTPHGWKRIVNLHADVPTLIVYDQDSGSVGDAVLENSHRADITFCPAIPNSEAWLFADSDAFFEVVGDRAAAFVGRLPLPEQLPYPKFLKSTMLRDQATYQRLLNRINIFTAGSRSPSLKYFVQQARRLADMPPA